MILAGDIGGTKTNLALYSPDGSPHRPVEEARVVSGQYVSLEAIVEEFLVQTKATIEVATFGVAGPVLNGRSELTNLDWSIDEQLLYNQFGLKAAKLLNDLVATANAVPILEADDIYTLHTGKAIPKTTIAVIAPGTGLGEAFLTWSDGHYVAFPSEGGHADYAPCDRFQLGLLNHLYDHFDGHVSTERVCSGSGIPNIYHYLKYIDYASEPAWLVEQIEAADDPTPIIIETAMREDVPSLLCQKTLHIFVEILGSECGNLALTYLSTGGVFLGGGIPPRIRSVLESERFLDAFLKKGRFSDMMKEIPIYMIQNPEAALLGAARFGYDLI
ncbi:MAG: glucokinase [Chloroflexota bacterium]